MMATAWNKAEWPANANREAIDPASITGDDCLSAVCPDEAEDWGTMRLRLITYAPFRSGNSLSRGGPGHGMIGG
jgi:hypothetical protein